MAGSFSNFASTALLQHVFGSAAFTLAGHHYLVLGTTVPDDTTTGVTFKHTDYTSYAPTEIGTGNNITDAWNAATGSIAGTVTNKNAITCPAATGASTNPILAIAVQDNASAGSGNILVWASVTSTAIASGDTPKVNAAALTITQD